VAPLAYLLSLFSGIVYLIATIALITPGRTPFRIAQVAITIELVGVLVVGTLSVVDLALFPFAGDRSTVWAYYGLEYLLIPLALPILGLLFLRSQRPVFLQEA
jgi:hypothetical protein